MDKHEKDLEFEEISPRPIKKAKRNVSVKTTIIVALIVAAAAFAVGTRSGDIMARLNGKSTPSQIDLSSLQSLYATLNQKYDGKTRAAKN